MFRKGKNFAWITLTSIITIAMVVAALYITPNTVSAQEDNYYLVTPSYYKGDHAGETFQVSVNVTVPGHGGHGMFGYSFKFYWCRDLINATDHTVIRPAAWGSSWADVGAGFQPEYNATHGRYFTATTALGETTPEVYGNFTLVTIDFEVSHKPHYPESDGYCLLNATDAALSGRAGYVIPVDVYASEYEIDSTIWEHDVAILSVECSADRVVEGVDVNVTVVVQNQGNNTETFDVSVYGNETQIDTTKNVAGLAKTEEKTLTFTWGTTGVAPGNYTIKANCTILSGEVETADNNLTDGWIFLVSRDVAVLSVEPEKDQVIRGDPLDINVTVGNLGKQAETFDVTVYGNASGLVGPIIINETQTVTNLAAGDNETLTFTWDTTTEAFKKYSIMAAASPVPDESGPILDNNNLTDGYVFVIWNDVAITSVTCNATRVNRGAIVSINATAKNQGKETINFSVTVLGEYYRDFSTNPVNRTIKIDTRVVETLPPEANQNFTFYWNTTNLPGYKNWTIKVEASEVGNTSYPEVNKENNVYEDGIVYVEYHDIEVKKITPSVNTVYKIWKVNIGVTVKNSGSENETFTLAAYYDNTEIETKTVTDLPPGEKLFTFAWDTTGVQFGNYSLKAVASVVPGELNLDNNNCTRGTAAKPAWVSIETERLAHEIVAPTENIYTVFTLSNSTVSPVPMKLNVTTKSLRFNVTGTGAGFCNVTIPKSFLRGDPNWIVYVDNTEISPEASSNDTYTSLYFTYEFASTLPVEIVGTWLVPEFPALLMLLSLVLLSLFAVFLVKKPRAKIRCNS
jgi:uncharacterized protein YbaA (DUF1428 family)